MAHPALILAASLVLQAPARPFQSKEGGFRIVMPAAPVEQAQEISAAFGKIDAHFFTATKGDVNYIVSYSDYPDQVAKDAPDQVLEGAAKGVMGVVKGAKLLKKGDRKIGPIPGKEVEFSFPGPSGTDGLGRAQLFLSGARVHSILVIGPKADVPAASDPFFRSFALIPSAPKAAAPIPATGPAMPAGRPGGPAAAVGKAEPFVSREHGFRVAMPARPQGQKITQPSEFGPVEVNAFIVQPQGDGLTYVVTVARLPGKAAAESPRNALTRRVDSTVASVKGTLVSQKEIRLGAVPGREFEFEMKGADGAPSYGRSRAFVANGRTYQLFLVGPRDRATGPAATAFLDSFALTAP